MSNTWIIDDVVVVYEDHGDVGTPVWVVSARTEEVDAARQRWQALWKKCSETPHVPPRVAEPLLDSADLLYASAKLSCVGSAYIDNDDCAWYHGTWQYLRMFDLVSSPNWHADFYADALRKALRGRQEARVLITGAADYATLAQVAAAADEEMPRGLEIHVLDLCLTPLFANRWYARRYDHKVHLHRINFLDSAEELRDELGGPFHLIVSDAFLTRFSRADAEHVMDNWRRLLAPDGRLVTTVRVYDGNSRREGLSREVTGYLGRLYERAKSSRRLLRVDFDELRDAAREYAIKMYSSDELGDAEQIIELFRENRLTVVNHEQGHVAGELVPTDYLRIVAAAGA
jgi:hypothetical protein